MNYDFIPFLLTVGTTPKLSFPRIIETLIIAIVTAVIINYTSLAVIKTDIHYIKSHVTTQDNRIEKLENIIFIPAIKETK